MTGLGAGVFDRLSEQGYNVTPINFSAKPMAPEAWGEDGRPAGGFANRRAELWGNMKRALESDAPFQLPDDNALQSDLLSCGYKFDSSGRLQLESKADMKKRGVVSPDMADALALTFAGGGEAVIPMPRASYAMPTSPFRRVGTANSWLAS